MQTNNRPSYPMYYLGRPRQKYVRRYAAAPVSPAAFMPNPFAR